MSNSKTVKDQILDWFERNATAKVRSGPLAKALKISATQVADALLKMAESGELMRVQVSVPANEREKGSRSEQWEYWMPLSGKAPAPVKPYKPQPGFQRPSSAAIPSKASGSLEISPAPVALKPADLTIQNNETPARDLEKLLRDAQAAFQASENLLAVAKKRNAELEESLAAAREAITIAQAEHDAEKVSAAEKLADAFARIAALEEALPSVSADRPASGFVVVSPAKPIKRFSKELNAKSAALSAAGRGKRAEVFSLHQVGAATPGAEWRPAK